MITKKNKNDALQRYGNKCYICETQHNLDIAHLVSLSSGGTNDIENLRPICHVCNTILNRTSIREFEFEKYLVQLIELNEDFLKTKVEKVIGKKSRKRVDIYTETDTNKYNIEAKAYTYIDDKSISSTISQIKNYSQKGVKLIFAFPGIAKKEFLLQFDKNEIEVWDIPKVIKIFGEQIQEVDHPFFKPLYQSHTDESIELKLIKKLKEIKAGKIEWSIYQKHLNDILERLFCPPLEKPLYESSDSLKINRRDYIMPNYCEHGFWAYLRDRYQADFIVIDAKNYKSNVKKKDILQIANYLKTHGAGKLGIIITRKGIDKSGLLTMREIWIVEKKLIIILTDEDIEQMLMLKSVGNNPEDILKSRIEEFRLSL